MSEPDTAPAGAAPEISFSEDGAPLLPVGGRMFVKHPDYINSLPYIERRRLTWEEFRQRAVEQNLPQPTLADWARTFELSDNEIDAAMAIRQMVYEAEFSDLEGHSLVRDFGGQPMVVWRDRGGATRHMKVHHFRTAHREKLIQWGTDRGGDPRFRPLVDVWLEHARTRRYDRVEFLPGVPEWSWPAGTYNLWGGWPAGLQREHELRPHVLGDPPPEPDGYDSGEEPEECGLLLDHLHDNVCGGEMEVYEYLLGWMAEGLIRPGHSQAAVVMTGPSGSGKGTFAELYGSLFGPHYKVVSRREQVVGKFNQHLMDTQLLFGDEIDFRNSAEANQQLRNLVTEPVMAVEGKGLEIIQARKWFRLMVATNERHVVGALGDDRRFLVLNVDAGRHNNDRAYFAAIRRQFYEGGGRVALFRWLTGEHWREMIDSGRWTSTPIPQTDALRDQKDLSLPPVEAIVCSMLSEGEVPCDFAANPRSGGVFVSTALLADAGRLDPSGHRALGELLRDIARDGEGTRVYLGAGRDRRQHRGHWLPALELCRTRFEQRLGRGVSWPEGVTSWALEAARGAEPPEDLPF